MKIRNFLLLFLFIGIVISIFLAFKFFEGKKIQNQNNLLIDNYYIKDIRCAYSYKMSSHIVVMLNDKEYYVGIPTNKCEELNDGKIKEKLYFDLKRDKIFYEDYYYPIGYAIITSVATFFLTILGFIVYRKELNNNYKTM